MPDANAANVRDRVVRRRLQLADADVVVPRSDTRQ
jgi:hypothetical protein